MALRPSRSLPRKFRRPATSHTKRLVARRYERRRKLAVERWKRHARKLQAVVAAVRRSLLRWVLAIGSLCAVGIVAFALFSPAMRIREVQVQRTDPRLDIAEVQQVLAPFFGRHLLFLPEHEVRQILRQRIADIASVDIGKQYPATLVVRIHLDELRARLVIVEPDQDPAAAGSGAVLDFLTEKGVYVASGQASPPADLPRIFLVDWGARPVPGSVVLEPQFLERMNATEAALLDQFGLGVEQRIVFLRAQEFHVDVGSYELWFDVRSSLQEQLGRFRTFLREVDPASVTSYIDLRLTDRVVYR